MKKVIIKISGMHCTSCAINIDFELEDTQGVKEAKTNYAKQSCEVTYDPDEVAPEKLIVVIKNAGYEAEFAQAN